MYYSDMPIESKEQDVLNRASFARLLANALIEYKNNETFTVGLFGKWGCGKTSLVNITLSEIDRIQSSNTNKDKELIVVHFNPWNFSSTDQLLTQFFLRLSNEFNDSNKELNKLATALEKYSAALNYLEFIPELGKATRFLSNTALFASKIIKNQEDRDVIKQKEYVIKLLEEQSNHILVVIDDIDRLTNEQIRYVFQLITSVANFPNTTYLLVFDKEIVANALSEVQTGNGEEYLEKIIQMPIAVPQIQKEDLHKFLFDRLESILAHYTDMIFEVHHWQSLFEPCVAPFIKQLRDFEKVFGENITIVDDPYYKDYIKPIEMKLGDSLPVSAFDVTGSSHTATSAYEKRNIATMLPKWIAENCIQCNQCSLVCPHAVIRPYLVPTDSELAKEVGIKMNFADQGIEEQAWKDAERKIALLAYEDQCSPANPKLPLVKDMEVILKKAYKGN